MCRDSVQIQVRQLSTKWERKAVACLLQLITSWHSTCEDVVTDGLNTTRQWVESVQRSAICIVTFVFVPRHAGFRGNERADRQTGRAIISEGQPLVHTDVINSFRDIGRVGDFGRGWGLNIISA